MNKELRIAKVNKIEYSPLTVSGIRIQYALAYIFELFNIKINNKNIFVDEYEVERKQLQDLQKCIASNRSDFINRVSRFEEYLEMAEINKNKFLEILDELIHKSDQQNPKILISWSDYENKSIDIDFIKSAQFLSEVVLGETLASIPADGLSLEEAFTLYLEAMYWGEGDCFYMITKEEDGIKIKSSDCAFAEEEIRDNIAEVRQSPRIRSK